MRGGRHGPVDQKDFAVLADHGALTLARLESQRARQIAFRVGEKSVGSFVGFFEFGEDVGGILRGSENRVAFFFEMFGFVTEAADLGRSPAGERLGEEENHHALLVLEGR